MQMAMSMSNATSTFPLASGVALVDSSTPTGVMVTLLLASPPDERAKYWETSLA
jgi:hypothetical protein